MKIRLNPPKHISYIRRHKNMSFSEKYRKFLEKEAKKAPIERKHLDDGRRFLISWWDKEDRVLAEKGFQDIIGSVYFGENPSKTVIMDQKVARMLRERIHWLEEENMSLHRQIGRMKIVVFGLVIVVIALIFLIFL